MSNITKVLMTGKTRTTVNDTRIISGNHNGTVNLNLSTPGNSTAPTYAFDAIAPHPTAEQLFAGAWSACYVAALGLVAKEKNVSLPVDTAVEIEVDLGTGGNAFFLQARLKLIASGIDHDTLLALAHAADEICPYSKATRGNIDVTLSVSTN